MNVRMLAEFAVEVGRDSFLGGALVDTADALVATEECLHFIDSIY
jgi:hypothetical protein